MAGRNDGGLKNEKVMDEIGSDKMEEKVEIETFLKSPLEK